MTISITSLDDARRLASAVRAEVLRRRGTTANQCILCTQVVRALVPAAVEMDGVIPGDWEHGGEHTIAWVGDDRGGWLIDAASEQYGLGGVMVCRDDEYADAYDSFSRCRQSAISAEAASIAAAIEANW